MERTSFNVRQRQDRACETCAYYGTMVASGMSKEVQFICRRRPPKVQVIPIPTPQGLQMNTINVWPAIDKRDWCGEFEPEVQA